MKSWAIASRTFRRSEGVFLAVTMKPMNRMPWGHACIWMHLAYHPSISKLHPERILQSCEIKLRPPSSHSDDSSHLATQHNNQKQLVPVISVYQSDTGLLSKFILTTSELLTIWIHFRREIQTDRQDALAGGLLSPEKKINLHNHGLP